MGSDAVGFFVEAMDADPPSPGSRRRWWSDVKRLHAEGLRAYGREWPARLAFSVRSGNQCAALLTIAIRRHAGRAAMGRSPDDLAAEMLRLPRPTGALAPPAARAHGTSEPGNSATDSLSADTEKRHDALRIRRAT